MLAPLRVVTVLAGAILAIVTAGALATAPSGQHPTPPLTGTIADRTDVDVDGIELKTEGPVDVATFTVTYDPAGASGWHTHPGVLVATVISGAVVRETHCMTRVYSAGESFVESDQQPSGQVRNASLTQPAVLTATQIVPAGVPRRVEADPPRCPAGDEDHRSVGDH